MMSEKTLLTPTLPQYFFSKNDPEDPRLGEYAKPAQLESNDLSKNSFAVIGYPDDEVIRLGGGRTGASEAPKMIRQFLYKMTPSLKSVKTVPIFDFGDLHHHGDLAKRHQDALDIAIKLHARELRVISFGGGHDYGYSDVAGFLKKYAQNGKKPLVINFDAQLDVRPTTNGFSSGTPFFRLLTEFGSSFQFVEIGLQPQCNSRKHLEWAQNHGAELFDLATIEQDGLLSLLQNDTFKNLTLETPVFVSFDIDALSATDAGGCSQAWVTGLKTVDCLNFLAALYKRSNVRGLGIYEVSPPLDRDNQTSKTAALLAHHFLFETK